MPKQEKIDLTKIQPIIDAIQGESDRACAILAIATLEALLEELLRHSMVPDAPMQMFEGSGAVATLSAKIDIAYSFGLITTEEQRDLHILRKIRNDFAHAINHALSFETTEVANRIRSLYVVQSLEGEPILAGDNDKIRWRFEVGTGGLISLLSQFRIPNAKQPNNPKGGYKQPSK